MAFKVGKENVVPLGLVGKMDYDREFERRKFQLDTQDRDCVIYYYDDTCTLSYSTQF